MSDAIQESLSELEFVYRQGKNDLFNPFRHELGVQGQEDFESRKELAIQFRMTKYTDGDAESRWGEGVPQAVAAWAEDKNIEVLDIVGCYERQHELDEKYQELLRADADD